MTKNKSPDTFESVEKQGFASHPPEPARVSKQDVRAVEEWARLKSGVESWQHAAAAALHCWHDHAHHAGTSMCLSESDYDAAVAAACASPGPGCKLSPHQPARSEYGPKVQP